MVREIGIVIRLTRAPDADDFGKFLRKLDPYNYMVLQTCLDGAEDREVPGSCLTQD